MRKSISSEIKRMVRKKCGFGCVLCGCPIYDYDHIEEYSIVQKHEADNLVLLCPTCHRKKTNKMVSKDAIKAAIELVKDRRRTRSENLPSPMKIFDLGSNIIRTSGGTVFSIQNYGEIRISFNEQILINGFMLDALGNESITISDNIYSLSSDVWDVEYTGNTLTFRDQLRKISAALTFDVENETLKFRGSAEIESGNRLTIENDGIYYKGNLLAANNACFQSYAGIVVTDKSIVHQHWVSGEASHNTVVNASGIAMLNCVRCHSNLFYRNEYSMIWTIGYLKNMKKK